jgi:LEA14-like dessication related protein
MRRIQKSAPLWIPVLTAFLFFPAAQAPSYASARKDLRVNLKEKRIRDLSSKGLTLAFHIAIHNSSTVGYDLSRYNYRVTINQKEFLKMSVALDEPIWATPKEDTLIALPLKISYDLLYEAVGPVLDKASCDAVGDLVFLDSRGREDKISFAFSGEFPIFKDPAIELLPLDLKVLTVGGSDQVFQVQFGNENSYELLVDKISYRLFFGERAVREDLIPGDKNIPPKSTKTFSLPFILDFFDEGSELYDLLQKPQLPCRLAGEIEVMSIWGKLRVSFDKQGSVSIVRPS